MSTPTQPPVPPSLSLRDGRDLIARLRGLAEMEAPPTLLPAVLGALGLGDRYVAITTPLGRAYVAYNETGVSAVSCHATPEAFEAAFAARFGRSVVPASMPPASLVGRLERRLRANSGDLRFDLRGLSEFERAVLLKALEIPRGEVRPYAWVAREIGHPKAVRAVGTALAHNPIPLLIPCHRVIRSDGRLGRYSLGGDDNKRIALAAEGLDIAEVEALARAGIHFVGSDTTHVYCYPTCRHARRISDRHRAGFASAAAAAGAGYRPCMVCRPAALAS